MSISVILSHILRYSVHVHSITSPFRMLKTQHELISPWTRRIRILLFHTRIINNMRREIRIDRRYYQFHL